MTTDYQALTQQQGMLNSADTPHPTPAGRERFVGEGNGYCLSKIAQKTNWRDDPYINSNGYDTYDEWATAAKVQLRNIRAAATGLSKTKCKGCGQYWTWAEHRGYDKHPCNGWR